jgi:hypothetical protein
MFSQIDFIMQPISGYNAGKSAGNRIQNGSNFEPFSTQCAHKMTKRS